MTAFATRSLRSVLLAAALTSIAGAALSDTAVGVDAVVRNAVQVRPASGGGGFRPAVVRETVRLGDSFASGAQSSLQILLKDRTVFTIGANARLTIDRFVYDPNRNSSDVAASVTKGAFRFMSGRPLHNGGGAGAISTPVATIGVRGTIVEGVVGPEALDVLRNQPGIPAMSGDPSVYTLIVLVGPGPNNQGSDRTGAIDISAGGHVFTLTRPGQAMLIWNGGTYGPFQLSDGAAGQLIGLLVPPPTPGAGDPTGGPAGSTGLASSGDPILGPGRGGSWGVPAGIDLPGINLGEQRAICVPNPNAPCKPTGGLGGKP